MEYIFIALALAWALGSAVPSKSQSGPKSHLVKYHGKEMTGKKVYHAAPWRDGDGGWHPGGTWESQ